MSQDINRIRELQQQRSQYHVEASEIRLKNAKVKAEIAQLVAKLDPEVASKLVGPSPACW